MVRVKNASPRRNLNHLKSSTNILLKMKRINLLLGLRAKRATISLLIMRTGALDVVYRSEK